MRNMLLPVLGIVFLLGCSDGSGAPLAPGDARRSAATTTENVITPVTLGVFAWCANGGWGETVYLDGSLHTVSHVTLDGAGGYHVVAQTQYQGVSGTGVNTGDRYQGAGGTHNASNGRVSEEGTFVNNFWIVGEGPDNNIRIHWTMHFTVNPDGTMTTYASNWFTECD